MNFGYIKTKDAIKLKPTKLILLFTFLFVLVSSVVSASPVPYTFMTINEYQKAQDVQLIDVRSEQSRERSNLQVANEIWINPYKTKPLEDFIANNDKTKSYVIFCSCVKDNYAIRAAQILTKRGFSNVKVLKDGWDSIQKSNMSLIKIKGDEQK